MRHLLISLFCLMVCMAAYGQDKQLTEAKKMIESFKTSNDLAMLDKASALVDEIFENPSAATSPQALVAKAQVLSTVLENKEVEDPLADSDMVVNLYADALGHDNKMEHRNNILNELYYSKMSMMTMGNKSYEEENYVDAYAYYQKAIKLNDLELDHPRHAPVDYSLHYTSAVFAGLIDKKEEMAKIYEELIAAEYPRADMYDNLMRYYTDIDKEEDVKRIKLLKEQRFPE